MKGEDNIHVVARVLMLNSGRFWIDDRKEKQIF
jgi:hypothetical protein